MPTIHIYCIIYILFIFYFIHCMRYQRPLREVLLVLPAGFLGMQEVAI